MLGLRLVGNNPDKQRWCIIVVELPLEVVPRLTTVRILKAVSIERKLRQ